MRKIVNSVILTCYIKMMAFLRCSASIFGPKHQLKCSEWCLKGQNNTLREIKLYFLAIIIFFGGGGVKNFAFCKKFCLFFKNKILISEIWTTYFRYRVCFLYEMSNCFRDITCYILCVWTPQNAYFCAVSHFWRLWLCKLKQEKLWQGKNAAIQQQMVSFPGPSLQLP